MSLLLLTKATRPFWRHFSGALENVLVPLWQPCTCLIHLGCLSNCFSVVSKMEMRCDWGVEQHPPGTHLFLLRRSTDTVTAAGLLDWRRRWYFGNKFGKGVFRRHWFAGCLWLSCCCCCHVSQSWAHVWLCSQHRFYIWKPTYKENECYRLAGNKHTRFFLERFLLDPVTLSSVFVQTLMELLNSSFQNTSVKIFNKKTTRTIQFKCT